MVFDKSNTMEVANAFGACIAQTAQEELVIKTM